LHFQIEYASDQGKSTKRIFNPLYFFNGNITCEEDQRVKFNFTSTNLILPLLLGQEPFASRPEPPTPSAQQAQPKPPPLQSRAEPPPQPVNQSTANASALQSNPDEPNRSASPPATRPKLLLVNFTVDKAKGVRTDLNLGSSTIKVREDIYSDLSKIKQELNKYDIPLTCLGYNPSLVDKNQSLLARVGLEIQLNISAGLTKKMNLVTDDYYIGPDYSNPISGGYKLKIYGIAKKNLLYNDSKYGVKTEVIDVYDIRETYNKSPPKILKIKKTFLELDKIFEDFNFKHLDPKPNFFRYSDVEASNWNIFQNLSKIVKGYTYNNLLLTVYFENKETIWNNPTLIWDGSKFI
jgi:hypothetical protein